MFQTALRWMGARWWAAAAVAATTIVMFRMGSVDAPSPVTPPKSFQEWDDTASSGVVAASYRKEASGPASVKSDLEFLSLRGEIQNLESALRWERERAALYSQGYEAVKRQYGEISRLASLLMEEAEESEVVRARTPSQQALVDGFLAMLRQEALASGAEPASFQYPRAGVPVPHHAILLEAPKGNSESNQ